MKQKALTQKERQIMEYIEKCKKEGKTPTNEEIATHIKAPHISGAQYYVDKLIDAGYLSRDRGAVRSLKIIKRDWKKAKISGKAKKAIKKDKKK